MKVNRGKVHEYLGMTLDYFTKAHNLKSETYIFASICFSIFLSVSPNMVPYCTSLEVAFVVARHIFCPTSPGVPRGFFVVHRGAQLCIFFIVQGVVAVMSIIIGLNADIEISPDVTVTFGLNVSSYNSMTQHDGDGKK